MNDYFLSLMRLMLLISVSVFLNMLPVFRRDGIFPTFHCFRSHCALVVPTGLSGAPRLSLVGVVEVLSCAGASLLRNFWRNRRTEVSF